MYYVLNANKDVQLAIYYYLISNYNYYDLDTKPVLSYIKDGCSLSINRDSKQFFYSRSSPNSDYQKYVDIEEFMNLATNFLIKLNDKYSALVTKDGVKVGCQIFPLEIIDKLAEAKKKLESLA